MGTWLEVAIERKVRRPRIYSYYYLVRDPESKKRRGCLIQLSVFAKFSHFIFYSDSDVLRTHPCLPNPSFSGSSGKVRYVCSLDT